MHQVTNCALSHLNNMEHKPVNFSIIKDKIIKTDELLGKLRQSQERCTELRNKCKQSCNALKRSQLECNRYATIAQLSEEKNKKLEEENKELNGNYKFLEDKYNNYVVDCMQTIKNLQDELQMLKELKAEIKIKKSPKTSKGELEKLKEHIKELLKENGKFKEESNKLNNLQSTNLKYVKEIEELKSQVKSNMSDISQLNVNKGKLENQIAYLNCIKEEHAFLQQENINLSTKLTEIKLELEQCKHLYEGKKTKEVYSQTDFENSNKTVHINEIVHYENLISELRSQVESKTAEIASYAGLKEQYKRLQTDIVTLTNTANSKIENKKYQTHNIYVQTDPIVEESKYEHQTQIVSLGGNIVSEKDCTELEIDSDFEIETVNDILKEMLTPRIVSPFLSHENSMEASIDAPLKIPSIIITPSTPTEKVQNITEFTLPFQKQDADVQTEECKEKIEPADYLKKLRFTYNDFVRQQQKCSKRRRLAIKRKLSRRRKKFDPHKDGFLCSLRALKRSNINFVISNDTALQQYPLQYGDLYNVPPSYNFHQDNIATPPVVQNIESLDCVSKNCVHKYMMVNKGLEGFELLGFFNVKPEVSTPTGFQSGCVVESKHIDARNTHRDDSKFIDHLADIVCQKLKNEGMITKTPKITDSLSDRSDSLCSETETELERLFRNTPVDILKQNKIMLEEARLQRRRTSTDESCPSRTDYTRSDNRHSATTVEENFNLKRFSPILNPGNNSNGIPSNSFDYFKVPTCPNLVSPIRCLSSIDTKHVNPVDSSPMRSSVSALTFSPEKTHVLNSNISVSSNTSFYINEILAQGEILTPNVNTHFESFSESKNSETPCRRISIDSEKQGGNDKYQYCLKSPESVKNYTTLSSPKIIPLERTEQRTFDPDPNDQTLNESCQSDSEHPFYNQCTSPRSFRRSKRISEKSDNVIKPKTLKLSDSENSDVEEESAQTNSLQDRLKVEIEKRTVPLIADKSLRTIAKKSSSGVQKTRKPVSKLQSKVLREVKLRRKMWENGKSSDVSSCDILDNNNCTLRNSSDRPSHSFIKKCNIESEQGTNKKLDSHKVVIKDEIQSDSSEISEKLNTNSNITKPLTGFENPKAGRPAISLRTTNDNKKNNKIHIVQNILIPPNSNIAVDLLKTAQKPKTPTTDIVSAIMENMDLDRPKSVMKKNSKPMSPCKTLPVLVDDKDFRTNVLDIADALHNNRKYADGQNAMPAVSKAVLESKLLQKGRSLSDDHKLRLKMLYSCLNKETIPPEVILLFKHIRLDIIIDIILNQVAKDFKDKPSIQYVNAPLLTEKQKLFLTLMLELDKEKHLAMISTFLSRTEQYFFYRGCNLNAALPIVRLYLTVCRLKSDIARVRKFVSDSFYFLDETAIPVFFTVLTNWVEVMPHFDNWQSYPLSKVLFQVIHLKNCPRPGYNLFPLKCLLSQYYGFPKERFNCDELFQELYNQYLSHPSADSDIAVRLLCKNKPKPWVYQKINQFFKPLVYKIPMENVNFKATVIIFIGKLCQNFRPKVPEDQENLTEMRRWFEGLIEDGAPKIINDSVQYVMDKLPKKKLNKKEYLAKKNEQK